MADYAGAQWIGPAHPENYFHGRIGYGIGDAGHVYTITAIGLHHTATTLQGAIDTFKAAPASGHQHSAHFIVDLDGARYQMLDTADTAFALGDEAANCYTVNIEVVQTWDFQNNVKTSDFTDAQYASVADICRIVAADEGFPPDAGHIHGHNFWIQTTCPADLGIARVIAEVEGGLSVTDSEKLDVLLGALGATKDANGDWSWGGSATVKDDLQSFSKWFGYDAATNPNPAIGGDLKKILQALQTAPSGVDLTPVLNAIKGLTLKAQP